MNTPSVNAPSAATIDGSIVAWAGPVLAPDGASARLEAPLAWALLIGGMAVFVGMLLLLWFAAASAARPLARPAAWWLGGGIVLPLALLLPLAAVNLQHVERLGAPPPPATPVVGVQGRLWWWHVRIQHPDGDVVLANEVVLPVGEPVRLALSSEGLIHSLWIPALAGKLDLVPGRVQHLVLQAERPGHWSGPCAEFCGSGHTRMVLRVRAMPRVDYDAWLARERADARVPTTTAQRRGRQHFAELRCGVCHTVRGVTQAVLGSADDRGGPDLTHLASRPFLGAGALPNDAAGLRAWITAVQQHKPGARMPAYPHLDADTLDALVAYLGSLE